MSDTVSPPVAPQPMQPLPGGPARPPTPGAQPGNPVLAALIRARQGAQTSAPGQGAEADALMKVKSAVDLLQTALLNLQPGSEPHSAVINAIRQLSRHVPQGAPTAGVQQTQLQDMLRNTMRNAILQRILSQRQGAGGGAPPMPPTTPMPGA